MAERTTGWRSILSVPAAYRIAQGAIGAPRVRASLVDEYLRPEAGSRVLDIGCGTGDLAPYLEGCEYVGYDHSESYIVAAREKYGDSCQFHVGSVGAGPAHADRFDHAVAKGVLHHLDDDDADSLFAEAHAALNAGGRLATIDPCWTRDQSRIAHFLVSRDRGENVRTPEEYLSIAEEHFDDVRSWVRTDLLRVPYSHAILVCTKAPPSNGKGADEVGPS